MESIRLHLINSIHSTHFLNSPNAQETRHHLTFGHLTWLCRMESIRLHLIDLIHSTQFLYRLSARLAFCTRKRSFACTQSQRLFHKKYPITVAYTKYTTSLIKNSEQVMFMNFTRITIKGNRGQNSGKSE